MVRSRSGAGARVLLATVVAAAGMAGLGQSPVAASVSSVSGSACGYYAKVGLMEGAVETKGCGQTEGTTTSATSSSPSVTLSPSGSNGLPVSSNDSDGAIAQFGPAVLFSGRTSESLPSGPLNATTQGLTGPTGSVTSSASVVLYGTPTSATGAGGVGPGPLLADEARSTCTADKSGVSASASVANGTVVVEVDDNGNPKVVVTVPANPPPNFTIDGAVGVGDEFRIVFNEQVTGPDAITVNAAHMYLLGPIARGELVIAQSHCGIASTVANGAPVANNDAYSTGAGKALTVPAAGLLANDTDPDGNTLSASTSPSIFVPGPDHPTYSTDNTYVFPSQPAHGNVTINPNGSFTYTPMAGYAGPDSFKYVARDPRGANSEATVSINVLRRALADFTGDGATDFAVFRPSTGTWFVKDGVTTGWGTNGDIAVPGDYDGNGTSDIAVFRPSTGAWFVQGGTSTAWGTNGDIPVPGDYDGNGTTDIAVFRPSTGAWFVRGGTSTAWGTNGDIPVPADYDSNGTADIAVFRPSTGTWFIRGGTAGAWGTNGDIPVPGDYNGNGTVDIAVFRPSTGTWFVQGGVTAGWGTNGDVPLPLAPSVKMAFF